MWPDPLFHLFERPVGWYFISYALALIPAIGLGLCLTHRRKASLVLGMDGALIAVIFAWCGSRLLYAVQWSIDGRFDRGFIDLLLNGGQASMGAVSGLLVGLALVFSFRKAIHYPLGAFDVVVPGVALFQGIARLGCFAAGCCYGTPAPGLPIAVTFTNPNSACYLLGVDLHPAQLYLSAGNFLIAGLLIYSFWQGARFRGYLLSAYLLSYGLLRFSVEFVRADHRPFIGELSVNQWICLAYIVTGTVLARWRYRHEPPPIAEAQE